MKIKVIVSIGLVGCRREAIIDVPDEEAGDDETVEEYARDEMFNMVEWGWERQL